MNEFSEPKPRWPRIRRIIMLDVGVKNCQLQCSYCYAREQDLHTGEVPQYTRRIGQLVSAFEPQRWGGVALVYLYADGEPLFHGGIVQVIKVILESGHYVAVVSNMLSTSTLSSLCCELNEEQRAKLLFFCSLHYLELARLGVTDVFRENVDMVRDAGCSCIIRLCLAPDYLPFLDSIRDYCREAFGGGPSLCHYVRQAGVEQSVEEELRAASRAFMCPAYDLQVNLYEKHVDDYCRAGEWSYAVSLQSGDVRTCLNGKTLCNLYHQMPDSVPSQAVGSNCPMPWCMCGLHLLSWGVRPAVICHPYSEIFGETAMLTSDFRRVLGIPFTDEEP